MTKTLKSTKVEIGDVMLSLGDCREVGSPGANAGCTDGPGRRETAFQGNVLAAPNICLAVKAAMGEV